MIHLVRFERFSTALLLGNFDKRHPVVLLGTAFLERDKGIVIFGNKVTIRVYSSEDLEYLRDFFEKNWFRFDIKFNSIQNSSYPVRLKTKKDITTFLCKELNYALVVITGNNEMLSRSLNIYLREKFDFILYNYSEDYGKITATLPLKLS